MMRVNLPLFLSILIIEGPAFVHGETGKVRPSVLMISHEHPGYRPSLDYMKQLHRSGFELGRTTPKETTAELLAKFNVVVLFSVPIFEPKGIVTDEMRRFTKAVASYARRGGGVLFSVQFGPNREQGYGVGQVLMAETFGAKLLWEVVRDPVTEIGFDPTGYHIPFAYSRELDPAHPITRGLDGIWYPTGGFSKNVATQPWEVSEDWTVLARGGPSSRSTPVEVRVPFIDKRARKKGYQAYVPIIVARELGKGRVVLCGINALFHLMGGHQAGLKRIVSDRGFGGRTSDVDKIVLRSIQWLSEPSFASSEFGGAKTGEGLLDDPMVIRDEPKLVWKGKSFGAPPKQYRGLMGARTSRSQTGHGSVSEYVQAAKKAGLDFITFLETWNDLSDEEWKSLIAECKSETKEGFIAYAGITFRDNYGGYWFAFAEDFSLPGPEFTALVDGEKRFWGHMGKVGAVGGPMHSWRRVSKFKVRVGSYRHKDSPWPYHSYRGYDSMAVVTSERGALKEDILDGYLHLQNRGEGLYPVAITLLDSPEGIEAALSGGAYWNSMTDEAVRKNRTPFDLYLLASDLRYLSNGPRIKDFRFLWHRDYVAIDWWRTDWYRRPMRIEVSSESGLSEVLLMNGREIYRRWLPGGAKSFVEELILSCDAQHDFVLVVKDNAGRRAVSSELITRNHMGNETMCADRMNQLGGSFLKRRDGRKFVFQPVATPWKGNNDVRLFGDTWSGIDPITGGGVRGIDGARGTTSNAYLSTVIWSKAAGALIEGQRFHRITDRVVGSPDMTRGFGLTDGLMVVDRPRNVWHDLVPVKPAGHYQEWGQRTYYTVRPELLAVEMLERRLSVFKDIDLRKPPANWRIGILKATGAPKFAIRSQGRIAFEGKINDYGLRSSVAVHGILGPGDYVAYYNAAVNNIAYMVLDGELKFEADLRNGWVKLRVPLDPGQTLIPAGTTARHTLLSLVAPNLSDNWPADSFQFAELFRDRMGLDGDVPYKFIPESGDVMSTRYVAVVQADKGAFVARTEDIHLPASLPLEVRGLNTNWSSGFADLRKKRYRPVSIHENKSFVTLAPLDPRQHFFVGHPAVADDPEVCLSCVQLDARNWALEIHNPTDEPREVTVRPSAGLTFLRFEPRTATLPPGTSVHMKIVSSQSSAP